MSNPPAAFTRTIPARSVDYTHAADHDLTSLLASAPETLIPTKANKIVLLGRGPQGLHNPAFDILAVLQDGEKRNVGLFLETRFSVAGGETTESADEIRRKLSLFDEATKKAQETKSLELKKEDIVYVDILNRSVTKNVPMPESEGFKHFCKEHVVILDRAKVRQVLTHSLADRALFLMDLRLRARV